MSATAQNRRKLVLPREVPRRSDRLAMHSPPWGQSPRDGPLVLLAATFSQRHAHSR